MSPTTPAERFTRAADGFLSRIGAVSPHAWTAESPCPDWTARDVVVHVINEARRINATVRRTEPTELHGVAVAEMGSLPATTPDADLAAAFAHVSADLVATIDDPATQDVEMPSPVGPLRFAECVDTLPADVLVHTWDLARATGGDERLDPEVVRHVHQHLEPLDAALRQPWAFGPKVTPPPNADEQTAFLCFLGRRP